MSTVTHTWKSVLQQVLSKENDILSGKTSNLNFITPAITSMTKTRIKTAISNLGILVLESGSPATDDARYGFSAAFRDAVADALGDNPSDAGEQLPDAITGAGEVPKYDTRAGAFYTIRCVYERPCGQGIVRQSVSERSQVFQLASIFDPDAPARRRT